MLGTTEEELILIRICIFLCRYTPLLYVAALPAVSFLGNSVWHRILIHTLSILLTAEVLFYFFVWRPFQSRLDDKAVHPEPLSPSERKELFAQCLLQTPSTEKYIRGWFLGAALEDIRRDNLREFFLWAFFEREGLDPTDADSDAVEKEIQKYIDQIEQQIGKKIEEGRGSAKSLRLTFDSIQTTYRSFVWYLIVFIIDQVTHWTFSANGFQYYSSSKANNQVFPPRPQALYADNSSVAPNLSYWYHPHQAGEESLPVVFFHGIGIGLWTYTRFLSGLRDGKRTGIIAIEILPVSFRLTPPPLGRAEFIRQMKIILDHHQWERFAVTSHSYGSVQVSHLLRSSTLQPNIDAIVLIDPVTILLHLPAVAFNFTRRLPKRANEWQLWYFASTDPSVARCLARHFFWRENILWKEQLLKQSATENRRVHVVLSGQDLITDVASVARYLETKREPDATSQQSDGVVKVTLFPDLDHAQVFDDPVICARVASLTRTCFEKTLAQTEN